MLLLVILLFILLLLLYILVLPIVLYIDTKRDQYYIQLKGIAKANVVSNEDDILKVNLKVLFMSFHFYPFRKSEDSKKKVKKDKPKTNKKRRKFSVKTGLKLLKSFKIKQFFINIDTGDCIENAKLFPLFALLNYKFGGFKINFNGENQLLLHIENRLIRIIKSFINS